jgi:hypothetical protein
MDNALDTLSKTVGLKRRLVVCDLESGKPRSRVLMHDEVPKKKQWYGVDCFLGAWYEWKVNLPTITMICSKDHACFDNVKW